MNEIEEMKEKMLSGVWKLDEAVDVNLDEMPGASWLKGKRD